MGPTLHREPGSHHATIVRTASRVTVRVPMLLGTRRVARVSRRRPRLVRGRVGGVDVITLPWSHMWALDEAGATQAGRLRHGGWEGSRGRRPRPRRWWSTRWRLWRTPLCGLIHAPTASVREELSRRVEGHAGPVCPGLHTLPLRAAFAPTGAFGSVRAFFMRKWRPHAPTPRPTQWEHGIGLEKSIAAQRVTPPAAGNG